MMKNTPSFWIIFTFNTFLKVAKNLKNLKTKQNNFFTIFPMGLNSQGMN
jgi:hypothetical protein